MTDPLNPTVADAKPCPFCGHQGVTVFQGDTYRWRVAVCDECGAQAPDVRHAIWFGQTPEQALDDANQRALKEWNTRA